MERYNFKIIENKWQKYWENKNLFKSKNRTSIQKATVKKALKIVNTLLI